MKLINLINVCDERITIILDGIDDSGKEIGYNFKENCWSEDAIFKPSGLITVEEFRKSKLYRELRSNRLEDFSTFPIRTVKAFSEEKVYRGTVLKIKIFLGTSKTSIAKAIENRVSLIAEKRCNMQTKDKNKKYTYTVHHIRGKEQK